MDIKLDNELISNEINKHANEAITSAFGSYQVLNVIKETVAEKVIGGLMASTLNKACAELDTNEITLALARELQKTVMSLSVNLMRENAVELLMRVTVERYASDDDRKQKRAELYARMFGKGAESHV